MSFRYRQAAARLSSLSLFPAAATTPATTPDAADRVTQLRVYYRQRQFLEEKLSKDNHHREELDEERQRIAQMVATPAPAAPVLPSEPHESPLERSLLQQLATLRADLAILQERDTDQHPDVIALREKISVVQSQLAQATAAAPPPAALKNVRTPSPGREAELARVNAQIVECEEQITEDLRQLAQLVNPAHEAFTAPTAPAVPQPLPAAKAPIPAPHQSIPSSPIQPLPQSTSAPLPPPTESQPGRSFTTILQIALACLALLIILPATAIFLLKWKNNSIRNESSLQAVLPESVEYIGSIPRMSHG